MQNILSPQEQQERERFLKECLDKARKADLSYGYYAKMADKSVTYEIPFDSAEKLIQAAKERIIIKPVVRSNPILFNQPRDFGIILDVEQLAISAPDDLERGVENQLIAKFVKVFFETKYPNK